MVIITPDDAKLPVIGFDVEFSEGHSFTVQMTSNPTESGSVFNDHVIRSPREFSCEVGETNQPIRQTFENEGAPAPVNLNYPIAAPSLTLFSGDDAAKPPTAQAFQLQNPDDRVRRMLAQLVQLQESESLVSIDTSRWFFESMKLIEVSEPGDKKHLGRFSLKFQELKVVSTETVAAPQPKEQRAKPTVDKGSQAPDPTDGILPKWLTEKSDKSLAARLADHISG
jgi:hypothetical protein